MKKIKLIIDSDLENVFLIGMTISSLCNISPLSDAESYKVELCAVEAINNSIIHAYHNKKGQDVEVIFILGSDSLQIDVYDTGDAMDPAKIEVDNRSVFEIDPNDVEIPEGGRGLAIIREMMDRVTYRSIEGKNCLSMVKEL